MNPGKHDAKSLKNINPEGFWEALIGTVKVAGREMGWTNRSAAFDTGTVSPCCIPFTYLTELSVVSRHSSSLLRRLMRIITIIYSGQDVKESLKPFFFVNRTSM
jgi:hypothetical protein